ncbi:MAG: hypothetical protein E6899_00175 [Neisseria sp.]|nr:hypothetical protein [Neisseria sp.]
MLAIAWLFLNFKWYVYSGLTLNQYGVASPCPDLKLIHYIL